jgi:hypothetical protein
MYQGSVNFDLNQLNFFVLIKNSFSFQCFDWINVVRFLQKVSADFTLWVFKALVTLANPFQDLVFL